jgi:hypothetical protein
MSENPNARDGPNPSVARFGEFSRTFSGSRADLWRLALDPSHSSRPCVTDGSSGGPQLTFSLSLSKPRCLDTASVGLTLTYHDFAGHAARLAVRMAALGVVSHDTTVAVSVPR